MNIQTVASLFVIAYFMGAIPFASIISKVKGVDLRKQGSGNAGATNVLRVMGWKFALPVFLLDGLKGWIPTTIAINFIVAPEIHVLTGFIAVLGHSLSVFIRFKGGKGAATGLGVLLALSPDVFCIVFVLAISLISVFRYVAPVTILCSIVAPIAMIALDYPKEYVGFICIISALIIIRHQSNIKRMLKGEENKI